MAPRAAREQQHGNLVAMLLDNTAEPMESKAYLAWATQAHQVEVGMM